MFFNDLHLSDLACENKRSDRKGKMENTFTEMGMHIHKTTFDPNTKNGLLPRDAYYGIECGPIWEFDNERAICSVELLSDKLRTMIDPLAKQSKALTVLVAGIGNRWLTADSLGPLCTEKLSPSEICGNEAIKLCAIAPGVSAQTGIATADIVRCSVSAARADLVIAVDGLRASTPERLGAFIQISNCGISPGSGVCGKGTSLSLPTVGVPVIGIGIPTVISASALLSESEVQSKYASMIVTSKDCDVIVSTGASMIAQAIEHALCSVW